MDVCVDTEITAHTELVRIISHSVLKSLSSRNTLTLDEVMSAGMVGLWKAIIQYEDQGYDRKTYYSVRIRGEIMDYLRFQDPAPRGFRLLLKQLRDIRDDYETEFGHLPSQAEWAELGGITEQKLAALLEQERFFEPRPLDALEQSDD